VFEFVTPKISADLLGVASLIQPTLTRNRVELNIYDPNHCDENDRTMAFDIDRVDQKMRVDASDMYEVPCFFPMKCYEHLGQVPRDLPLVEQRDAGRPR
jgi:hypothetical protein